MTILNNSTVPLNLETCNVIQTTTITGSSSTITESNPINGAVGGPASGIQANSQATISCAVSTAPFANEAVGSPVSGSFMVKLVNSWYSYPAGTETSFSFQGTWSN